jgi:LPS export ABC transporter protein LptC
MIRSLFYVSVFIVLCSCSNDLEEVNALLQKEEIKTETAVNIELLYSDSAQVKLKIIAPILKRKPDGRNSIEEFDQGLVANFYGPDKRVNCWLASKYAIRNERKNTITVRDSVVLWNKRKEKLETSELIWDEKEEILSTNKFVRITQPEKGDTSYGWGFESNADFTRFEIKNKFSSKMSASDISAALGEKKKTQNKPQE